MIGYWLFSVVIGVGKCSMNSLVVGGWWLVGDVFLERVVALWFADVLVIGSDSGNRSTVCAPRVCLCVCVCVCVVCVCVCVRACVRAYACGC